MQKNESPRGLLYQEKAKKLRTENKYADQVQAVKAASSMFKEAKALAENGAPEAMVKGIRERAAAIVETMETMETGAVEGDPNI
jgi:hypothetical protein